MPETRFEDFVGIISALGRRIQRIKTAEARRLGFRGSDVMCLYYLVKNPEGLTASELARLVDVSRAAMSRTVSHLEEDGLVEVGAEEGDAAKTGPPFALPRRAARPRARSTTSFTESLTRLAELAARQRLQMYDSLNHILERLRSFGRDSPLDVRRKGRPWPSASSPTPGSTSPARRTRASP